MIKYFFFLLMVVIFFNSNAQGNLQFNQVLTYQGNSLSSPIWTVPSGKVWKIESAIPFNNLGTSQFLVNNFTVLQNNSNIQPIWLKSGDNCRFTLTSTFSSYSISIIEFNIIP